MSVVCRWPAEPHTLCLRNGKPSVDSLADHFSLKLRNRAENVQLQARRRVRRGRVDTLGRDYQRDVVRRKLTYDLGQICEASAKPIQLETHNDIDLRSAHRQHEAI